MKITIIGTGNVGSTLGGRWAGMGHQIIYGTRNPESNKIKSLLELQNGTQAKSIKDATASSGVIVLATPWTNAEETIKNMGDLTGKIIIDCTNPLKPDLGGLSLGFTTSAGEKVAEWAVGAHVIKAFNNTGSKNMGDPVYGSEKASMFICGDNDDAKKMVEGLISDLDFDVVDCGGITASRYLEPLAMLWIHLVFVAGMGQDIAFRLLRR